MEGGQKGQGARGRAGKPGTSLQAAVKAEPESHFAPPGLHQGIGTRSDVPGIIPVNPAIQNPYRHPYILLPLNLPQNSSLAARRQQLLKIKPCAIKSYIQIPCLSSATQRAFHPLLALFFPSPCFSFLLLPPLENQIKQKITPKHKFLRWEYGTDGNVKTSADCFGCSRLLLNQRVSLPARRSSKP